MKMLYMHMVRVAIMRPSRNRMITVSGIFRCAMFTINTHRELFIRTFCAYSSRSIPQTPPLCTPSYFRAALDSAFHASKISKPDALLQVKEQVCTNLNNADSFSSSSKSNNNNDNSQSTLQTKSTIYETLKKLGYLIETHVAADVKREMICIVDEIELWAMNIEKQLQQVKTHVMALEEKDENRNVTIVAYEIPHLYMRNILLQNIRTKQSRMEWHHIVGIVKSIRSYEDSARPVPPKLASKLASLEQACHGTNLMDFYGLFIIRHNETHLCNDTHDETKSIIERWPDILLAGKLVRYHQLISQMVDELN